MLVYPCDTGPAAEGAFNLSASLVKFAHASHTDGFALPP